MPEITYVWDYLTGTSCGCWKAKVRVRGPISKACDFNMRTCCLHPVVYQLPLNICVFSSQPYSFCSVYHVVFLCLILTKPLIMSENSLNHFATLILDDFGRRYQFMLSFPYWCQFKKTPMLFLRAVALINNIFKTLIEDLFSSWTVWDAVSLRGSLRLCIL